MNLFCFFAGALLLGGLAARPAAAQCLTLAEMDALGSDPRSLSAPEKATVPGAWAFQGWVPKSHDVYWNAAGGAPGAPAPAVLLLRSQQQQFDVVLKTTLAACPRQIRSSLKEQKITPVPVNCPGGCEAQRYDGTDYQVTLYSKMKGDYPFVVVLHPLHQPPQPPAATAVPEPTPASTKPAPGNRR